MRHVQLKANSPSIVFVHVIAGGTNCWSNAIPMLVVQTAGF